MVGISVERGILLWLREVIHFRKAQEVGQFVRAAERCRNDVDIYYNRVVIDAKSLMGVLGMDLTRDLTVRYDDGEDHAFGKVLDQFAV